MSEGLYSRQSTLSLLSYDYAVVVGLGGIGNWIALDLALSGQVRNLILIDPDTVEEHNLNRTIFRYCDIGAYKVDAVKYQILERRANCLVETYRELTSPELMSKIADKVILDKSVYDHKCLVMDCRDDIYDDLLDFNCKLYKVGYDGTSMSIDGNPRLTKVFTQRGGSYSVVPSYIGSSQMVAVMAVNDALGAGIVTPGFEDIQHIDIAENPFLREFANDSGRDEMGRLNCSIRFGCQDVFPNCSGGLVKDYNKANVLEILESESESEKEPNE